ncbi:hypothetical protein CAY53_06870 [Desulfobulbus oralis]|uniref:Uncharacterized protein n=1 Tax=Desulfobulbus oralis TaxID=1986146 RepID=A0A2L1GNI2_9BACT|nr:hypothetical protein CAY53_06870 [Desulfobulbus oralis]
MPFLIKKLQGSFLIYPRIKGRCVNKSWRQCPCCIQILFYLLHPGLQCITELLHRPSGATDHAPASFENFFPFDIGFAGRTKAIGAFAGHLRLKAFAQHLDRIAALLEADTLGISFFVARRDAIVKGQHILFPD